MVMRGNEECLFGGWHPRRKGSWEQNYGTRANRWHARRQTQTKAGGGM